MQAIMVNFMGHNVKMSHYFDKWETGLLLLPLGVSPVLEPALTDWINK